MLKPFFIVITSSFFIISCNPCRQLAEQMCECLNTEGERHQCTERLNMAEQHEYFETAKDAKVCEQALKQCSCKSISEGNNSECGLHR